VLHHFLAASTSAGPALKWAAISAGFSAVSKIRSSLIEPVKNYF